MGLGPFGLKASALVLGLAAVGCGAGPVWLRDDPCEVARAYLAAVESQDCDAVWEFLSGDTRDRLVEAAADVPGRTPSMMIRAGHVISSTREYKKFELASRDERSATVSIVLVDGTEVPFVLTRENDIAGGRWAVGLPLMD